MPLIDDVKVLLRLSKTTIAFDSEISDLISAAEEDLKLSGLLGEAVVGTDPLIKRAIATYVKANFGWDNPDADRLRESYAMLKTHLALAGDYTYYKVTFIVTDSDTGGAIRQATVRFSSSKKDTGTDGAAVFYVRKGVNYEYVVSAGGYEPEDDLLDVSASATISVDLTAR